MSGYLEGILVLLAVNVVFAYSGFLPLAAGQLNLGLAGFAAIGAYASAYLSNVFKLSPLLAIPSAGLIAGLVALAVAVPVLRTRGIYLALATFALGQIVQAIILNLEIVGGAAGYPVAAFIRFPTIAAVAVIVVLLVWLLFGTRFGIAVTAVHDDERVADLMGIDVRAFQIAAFALGSAIAGIGGGLYAHHFSFIEAQYFNISLSITIVLSLGALYEILEWIIAITFSVAQAEAYNGQQGDLWDPQKDLALALLGAMVAAMFVCRWKAR